MKHLPCDNKLLCLECCINSHSLTMDDQCLINLHNAIGQLRPTIISPILSSVVTSMLVPQPLSMTNTVLISVSPKLLKGLLELLQPPPIIDLIFLSAPDTLVSHSILTPVSNGDHYILNLSLSPTTCQLSTLLCYPHYMGVQEG